MQDPGVRVLRGRFRWIWESRSASWSFLAPTVSTLTGGGIASYQSLQNGVAVIHEYTLDGDGDNMEVGLVQPHIGWQGQLLVVLKVDFDLRVGSI